MKFLFSLRRTSISLGRSSISKSHKFYSQNSPLGNNTLTVLGPGQSGLWVGRDQEQVPDKTEVRLGGGPQACHLQAAHSRHQQGPAGQHRRQASLAPDTGAILPHEVTPASHRSFMFPSQKKKKKPFRSTKLGSFTLLSTVISGLKKTTGLFIKSLNCHSHTYRMLRHLHLVQREN